MKTPHPTQVRQAIVLLEEVMARQVPADAILASHFRRHKQMGGRDRAHLSALIYGVLRNWQGLRARVGDQPPALIGAVLHGQFNCDASALARLGFGDAAALVAQLEAPRDLPWTVQTNLPALMAADFKATLPEAEWQAAAEALNAPGTVDFRVNRRVATRAAVLADLAARGIEAAPTPWAPDGVRLARRLPNGDWLLRHGAITPQDEGSQWLVHCLPLQAHESVLDYCAGAGGKALALAALLNEQGRVTATDFDAARLTRLAPRAAQASAEVTVLAFPPSPELRFDGVLVDAPCSGTGSLRRAPERRLDTPDIAALAELQGQVLADAARHVAPGGWLVYATCSVLTAENEAVIQAFTAAQGAQFTPCPLKTPEGGSAPTIRLWPHRHNTDGFFAAGWRRAA